jgi:hypothetical protein
VRTKTPPEYKEIQSKRGQHKCTNTPEYKEIQSMAKGRNGKIQPNAKDRNNRRDATEMIANITDKFQAHPEETPATATVGRTGRLTAAPPRRLSQKIRATHSPFWTGARVRISRFN